MPPEDTDARLPAPDETPSRPTTPTKLRFSQTGLIAISMIALMGTPFALSLLPWSLAVYLLLAIAVFVLRRTGAWISADSITVTGPFYRRTVALRDVAGLSISARGGVFIVRTDGSALLIPTARARDLPRLRELMFGPPHQGAEAAAQPDIESHVEPNVEPDI